MAIGNLQTDDEIKAELNRRLTDLLSGKDPGLTFEQVFGPEQADELGL